MSVFERQLQALIQSAEDLNRQELQVFTDVAEVMASYARAKERNIVELRRSLAGLVQPQPQRAPPPPPMPHAGRAGYQ